MFQIQGIQCYFTMKRIGIKSSVLLLFIYANILLQNSMTADSTGENLSTYPNIFIDERPILRSADTNKINVSSMLNIEKLKHKPANYNVMTLINNINTRLSHIRNVELDITTIQEIFDAVDFTVVANEANETLRMFTKQMKNKLQKASESVLALKTFFDSNITSILADTFDVGSKNVSLNEYLRLDTIIQPCPLEDSTIAQNYNKQQIKILNYLKNKNFVSENSPSLNLNRQILKEIRRLNDDTSNFKHVFYLSNNDYATDHNCQFFFNNINFRQLYASTVLQKYVFILLDVGSMLTAEQLELSKRFVSNIVQMLSDLDYLTIVCVSDSAEPMVLSTEYATFTDTIYKNFATPDNKELVFDFISSLKRSMKVTNHTLGFEYSFDLLRKQNLSDSEPFVFLYVTRGLLTRLSDAKNVLQAISRGQQSLSFPIIINTCAVILDEKRIMYEKQFLTDIVHQNYSKYEIDMENWYSVHTNLTGNLYIVTKRHPERIIKTSTAVFTDLFHRFKSIADGLRIHSPTLDFDSNELIVSITHAIANFGVVGVNLYLSDIAEDVENYKNTINSYACLLNMNGIAIIHPAFQRLHSLMKTPLSVDIAYLENSVDFLKARHLILTENSGNITIDSYSKTNTTKRYLWNRVLDTYIICIVTVTKAFSINSSPHHQIRPIDTSHNHCQHPEYVPPVDLLFHRIDLIPPQTPVCRYIRQMATLDSTTVFLGASSFQSPFTYFKNNRINCKDTKIRIFQTIMAYIRDNSGLFANPGLLPRIRKDVSAIYNIMEILKKRHLKGGEFKNYIIRRYAATVSGVLQVFPGCILATNLDPSERPWFRKAMQHPGRIVVTEPYLDAGGSGYIVTIAHTVFEGKVHALHNSERDSPVAIVALDVPYAFFYKSVLDTPLCQEENIKCILFENEGYLIAHPSMMDASLATKNIRRPHEHLTHKESYLANDILNHKTLVTKLACANYRNRTVQRYYSFNTSLTEILTNVVNSERTKYQIAAIAGTNMFAAVLNSTCDGGAFCPCSTVDRICLNCNRMDQSDCECPCECPMHLKGTIDKMDTKVFEHMFGPNSVRYENCELESSNIILDNLYTFDWSLVLDSCLNINCDIYNTQIECLAIIGCEWCQLDIDGNPFGTPFCTTQNSCFNGVLGSMSPYGDGGLDSTITEPSKTQSYSAIGPVGGAIAVLCLVIGFAMYCYRQSLENSTDQFCVDSIHDDNCDMPLSRFNFDNIPPPDDDMDNGIDRRGGMQHKLVNPLENSIAVPDISPYHMSTGSNYRRPPNGESDHGYSTMTPHEDSEHMCFTLAEPLINNKRLSKSHSVSINTLVSSPNNQHIAGGADRSSPKTCCVDHRNNVSKNNCTYGQTFLSDCNREFNTHQQLSPHHVLARVTVHRHMEAL